MVVTDLPVYGGTLNIFGSYFMDPDFFKHHTHMQAETLKINNDLTLKYYSWQLNIIW